MPFDELMIYRGKDYSVCKYITVHSPTLDEICDYGEKKYFQMIQTLTSAGADLKWQLFDAGVDYTKVSDFELFYNVLITGYSQKDTSIIFGDLDFSKFQVSHKLDNNETCIAQKINNDFVIIDEYTCMVIVDFLRKMHGFRRNDQIPANESTKQILIDDARDEYLRNKDKEYVSILKNLISTMVNSEGFKYNHDKVWAMKINAFIDSVRRIKKIKYADLLLQSGYSGSGINLKEINYKEIDWLGELEE